MTTTRWDARELLAQSSGRLKIAQKLQVEYMRAYWNRELFRRVDDATQTGQNHFTLSVKEYETLKSIDMDLVDYDFSVQPKVSIHRGRHYVVYIGHDTPQTQPDTILDKWLSKLL